jgi:hypothetical protein
MAAHDEWPGARRAGHAEEYPVKPVRVVVAFTAGGTTDMLARSVSQQLAQRFKQSFVVDNRPAPAAISAPSSWCARRPMATRCWSTRWADLDQPDALQEAELRPADRSGAGGADRRCAQRAGGASVAAGKELRRIRGLCQGQPGKLNYSSTGVGRRRTCRGSC